MPATALVQPVFINIGEERGLSSQQITDLFQDSRGFVWIGTPHGLNRFDGYGCVQYFNLPGDTTSISSSHISPRAFAEDPAGNLWVATFRGGLNYFHRDTERFTRYRSQRGQDNRLSMDKLFAVEPDNKGGLWIATAGRGINYFDPRSQTFRVSDVYLPKPFDREELLIRLEKLIELRRRLQERYAQFSGLANALKIDPSGAPDSEEQFLQKAVRFVEAHISDEDFGMPELCKALNMSRTNLFRKLKALTGQSATDFIRHLRLEKAKVLLETTDMNVTEASYAVGFGSPNYFSRAFQETFGISPKSVKKV